jgi:hypothetical protein
MKTSLLAFGLVVTAFCAAAAAQTSAPAPATEAGSATFAQPSLYTAASPFRLFDPARLKIGQSYSLSYFSGGPGGSQSVGVYTSSIGYQLADPLYMQLDLGVVHSPGALFGGEGRSLDAQIRPNFFLRYTPSNKFNLLIDVRTFPSYGGGYGFGYGPRTWRP